MALIQKTEVKISLGTGLALTDAKAHAVYLAAIYQDFFGRLRMAEHNVDEENGHLKRRIHELERDQTRQRQRFAKSLGNRRTITLDVSTDMALPKSLGGAAEVPIREHRVNVDEVATEWAKETADANRQVQETGVALAKVINGAGSLVQPTAPNLPTVSEFLPTFVAEKSKKWGESSRRHNLNALDLFVKIVGDKSLSDYDRRDIVNYVGTLELVHKSYGKSDKDKDRSIAEILAVGDDKQKMSITTLVKHFRSVKGLFKTANQYHDTAINIDNLFGGQDFSRDVRQPDKRIPWSVDDLNRLFATPVWTGTSKAKRSLRHNKGNRVIKDAYWWLPVIGIFTGMRLEEICQLQAGDLKTVGGIQYLDVVEGEGKRLKTASSARQVPLHGVLTNLGFVALFDKNNASQRIFADLTRGGADRKFGYEYSGDFTTYRRKTGTYEEWKDFHSFRHTFISALWKQTKGNMVLTGAIVGHESTSQTEGYTHIDLETKAEAIALLTYDGLDISHLYPS